jgi:isopenicillin N synthase-like dioxygenase
MSHSVDDQTLQRATAFGGTDVRQPVTEVPVIDVSAFLRPSEASERQAVGRQIRAACIDIGFFYISGHGFSSAELDDMLVQGHRFFTLPSAEKCRILASNSPARLGYIQTGGLNPAVNLATRPDLKERLFMIREPEVGEHVASTSHIGQSQWPDAAALPGFEVAMKAYTTRTAALARALVRAFAVSLNLPEHALDRLHDRMECGHAFNFYPPSDAAQEPAWGFTPHTDYGSFTILLQDQSGGLQARNAAGNWIAVPPVKDTFVINVADLLARCTNDLYVSTLHRVVSRTSSARLSISYFATPNPDAEMAVFESCISPENPARYPPVIAGEYTAALLDQAFRTGQAGVSARTAERLTESS